MKEGRCEHGKLSSSESCSWCVGENYAESRKAMRLHEIYLIRNEAIEAAAAFLEGSQCADYHSKYCMYHGKCDCNLHDLADKIRSLKTT